MCRTKKLKEIGGFIDFPLAWGSDDATWYKLAENSDILYSKEVLSNWRYSEINLSRIGDFEKIVEALNKFSEWLRIYISALPIKRNIDIYLKRDILISINKYVKNSKRNLLIRTAGNKFYGGLNIIKNYLKLHGRCFISLTDFLYAFLGYYKNYYSSK